MTHLAAAEIRINGVILGLALVMMAIGLALFFWGVRGRNLRFVRAANPVVWAFVAMGPALLFFSIFPDSKAEGPIGGFTLGGAFAAFALVWWQGQRLTRAGIDADEKAAAQRLAARPGAPAGGPGDPVIEEQDDLRYTVKGRRGREIVILTGDLLRVRRADVWVSPENTNMQPARFHERSVSALIRYYGATRDPDGDPVDDLIGDELADAMRARNKSVVPAAAVLTTTPGALAGSNGVKRVYHVAAVEGAPGAGYRPVAEIGRCVTRALERMDAPEEAAHGAESIVFPLLATGVAGGDPAAIAAELVSAAVDHLRTRDETRVRRVYLLAFRESELGHWMNAADGCGALARAGGSVDKRLEPAAL